MASGSKVKKHKCSCGRSFRHAISLKRHQNVTGCAPADAAAGEEKVSRQSADDVTSEVVEAKPKPPIEITPEVVACWQEQTGFNRTSVVDTIPQKAAKAQIDWLALAATTKAFIEFCGELQSNALRTTKSAVVVLGRSAIFFAAVILSGWLLVTSVSASGHVTAAHNTTEHDRVAAQTVVADFLQHAKLNHYTRAHALLTPDARHSVSPGQLQYMMNSLPIHQKPAACTTQVSDNGEKAQVTLKRDGQKEVYRLTKTQAGWGLSSVAVANS